MILSQQCTTSIPKACDYTGDSGTTVNPFGTGPRRSNPVQRAMSKSAGKKPPPLPPPNKAMYDSLTEQNKGWLIHHALYMLPCTHRVLLMVQVLGTIVHTSYCLLL